MVAVLKSSGIDVKVPSGRPHSHNRGAKTVVVHEVGADAGSCDCVEFLFRVPGAVRRLRGASNAECVLCVVACAGVLMLDRSYVNCDCASLYGII